MLSREALIQGFIDAATMLDIAGGVLEVIVGRGPTDMPGEMVMTGAAFIWKDRTDATTAAEQPFTVTPQAEVDDLVENAALVTAKLAGNAAREHDREVVEAVNAGADVRVEAGSIEPSEENPDGFDYSKLAEEDVEDEPLAAARR